MSQAMPIGNACPPRQAIACAACPRHLAGMLVRRLLCLSALAAALCGAPAMACSPAQNYRIPTTLELVEQADAIVLARVDAETATAMRGMRRARLTPIALLKGAALPRAIAYDYAALSSGDVQAVASDPRNLTQANPDAFSGACNRTLFDENMIVVAFLKQEGANFVPYAPPFSRALEDVPSPDALWVKAVKLYIGIAAVPPAQRRAAMAAARNRLSAASDDPDARALARDLERTLAPQP